MKCKTAFLIINAASGRNVKRLSDILAVFSAAGWKTDTAVKEFGGHTKQLGREAADAGYDLVIACGGDGTLNQVINGVMAAKRQESIVGLIPGGTANVWAHELGVPEDPVKAALFLINSSGRTCDLGHVEVVAPRPEDRHEADARAPKGRHHFLLMAGLGLDAAVLRQVSKPLKESIGTAAVAFAAVKEMPFHKSFPIEIRTSFGGTENGAFWEGEAVQVIVGNTRRYGNIVEVTPDAFIDDALLDVCVITAGNPLTTFQQFLSKLLRRKPVNGRSENFRGAHFWITVPTSVDLQLDGSRVKRKDRWAAPDLAALERARNPEDMMVTYRFDSVPRALQLAIPHTYDGALFEGEAGKQGELPDAQQRRDQAVVRAPKPASRNGHREDPKLIAALLEHGRKVTVVGVGPNPEREGTSIVAGGAAGKEVGESTPVAVCIDHTTTFVRHTGESLPATFAAELSEGRVIVVDGEESKRGVIRAKHVVVVS